MRLRIFTAIIFLPFLLEGQEVLNEYVRYGIENNLSLQQKQSGYQKSIEALKEARGLFYPNISFNARYTVSEGGRIIDFPIGDLLNPVYTTLNTLTSSNKFSVVDNQQIMFMRPFEHETKIRIIQPVFNTDIYYNSQIKKELMDCNEQKDSWICRPKICRIISDAPSSLQREVCLQIRKGPELSEFYSDTVIEFVSFRLQSCRT